ncbi:hypothetical protein SBA3_2580011 [Candidatus Sulfopaludibacter sp. SbA3]|nr:hypothetical protein SBA3_2580011 [Candidatus Sulfopaludibacter sp. SbA3]
MEKSFAQSIADDRWRLLRCAAIEHTRFSMGMSQPDQYFAHHPEIDAGLAQAVTWAAEATNFNLMSLYENRAQRRVERNMIILKQLQAERKAALDQVVEEATLLAQYAASKAEPYNTPPAKRNPTSSNATSRPKPYPHSLFFHSPKSPFWPPTIAAWPTPKSTSRPPNSPSARLPEPFSPVHRYRSLTTQCTTQKKTREAHPPPTPNPCIVTGSP